MFALTFILVCYTLQVFKFNSKLDYGTSVERQRRVPDEVNGDVIDDCRSVYTRYSPKSWLTLHVHECDYYYYKGRIHVLHLYIICCWYEFAYILNPHHSIRVHWLAYFINTLFQEVLSWAEFYWAVPYFSIVTLVLGYAHLKIIITLIQTLPIDSSLII